MRGWLIHHWGWKLAPFCFWESSEFLAMSHHSIRRIPLRWRYRFPTLHSFPVYASHWWRSCVAILCAIKTICVYVITRYMRRKCSTVLVVLQPSRRCNGRIDYIIQKVHNLPSQVKMHFFSDRQTTYTSRSHYFPMSSCCEGSMLQNRFGVGINMSSLRNECSLSVATTCIIHQNCKRWPRRQWTSGGSSPLKVCDM